MNTIKNEDLKFRSMKPIFIDKLTPLIYPISVFDFYENIEYFHVLSITIINLLQEVDMKDIEKKQYIKDNVKDFDVVMSSKPLIGTLVNLIKLQCKIPMRDIKVLREQGQFYGISIQEKYFIHRDNYDAFRQLLIAINDIKFPKQVEDKELNMWFERARRAKSKDESPTMGEILDLLCIEAGIDYDKLMYDYSIYRVNRLVERYGAIQEFKTNVQYICGGAEDVTLKSYLTHINTHKEEQLGVSFSKFTQEMSGTVSL